MPVSCIITRVLIGWRPAVHVADDLHRLVHLGDQLVLRHPRTPLGPRLQRDGRLDHLDRRRIGRRIRAPELAEHALDLRKLLQLPVHLLDDPAGLARRQARQRRRHVQDRALLHLRHVVLLEARHERDRDDQQHGARGRRTRSGSGSWPGARRDRRERSALSRSPSAGDTCRLKIQTMTTGSRTSVSSVENAIANVLLNASGLKSRPSRSPRKKIGRNDVTMMSIENSSGLVIVAVA